MQNLMNPKVYTLLSVYPQDSRTLLTLTIFQHANLPLSARKTWISLLDNCIHEYANDLSDLNIPISSDTWIQFCKFWTDTPDPKPQ